MKCKTCNGTGKVQEWIDRETNVWYYEDCPSTYCQNGIIKASTKAELGASND